MKEQIARNALDFYALDGAEFTLLGDLWNTTYVVRTADGQQYNLRICGAAFQDRKCLEDELIFTEFVSKRGALQIPAPVRNREEGLVTIVPTAAGSRQCCLFKWIEGEEARGQLSNSLLRQMGQAAAHLHLAAQAFAFPTPDDGFRKGYYFDEVLAASHRAWIEQHGAEIGEEQVKLLHRAIDHVLDHFERIGKTRANYGFIHADLHPGNFLICGEQVAVIDFDQLGRGHFAFDLAVMRVELQLDEAENFQLYWESFKTGYQDVAELPVQDDRELAPFTTAVHLGFLDFFYNSPNPEVRKRFTAHIPQTYRSIRQWVDGTQKA